MNTPESTRGNSEKMFVKKGKDPLAKWADPQPKPEGYVPPAVTVLDRLLAGKLTPKEVADSIVEEAYGPLKQFCSLPAGFKGRTLGYEQKGIATMTADQIDELNRNPPSNIVDPEESQVLAIELLQLYLDGDSRVCKNNDPYQPIFGANFVGKPGCGKTHIMSAFAQKMSDFLSQKLTHYRTMVTEFVSKEYVAYQHSVVGLAVSDQERIRYTLDEHSERGQILEKKPPAVVFQEKLDLFMKALSRLEYQPPDLLYLDFEQLWELCRGDNKKREQALDAIIRAKVLFLDDVHPKGDLERVQIVLHLIEGRYAAGRMGTFITTNLSTEELAGGDKQHIFQRLQSRCNEMFYQVEFKDCLDWRTAIKQRRISIVQQHLEEKVSGILGAREPFGDGLNI